MDYVVGGVAALISGNVTPSRPKHLRRPLTPTKHQPSPNVTPKSEFVDDRSIFLSPTLQKKKAIVKKSPKRIFQNPDLEETAEGDKLNSSSPKIEKVKKHLKSDLDADSSATNNVLNPKSPKVDSDELSISISPKKKSKIRNDEPPIATIEIKNKNPLKKKKKNESIKSQNILEPSEEISSEIDSKKRKKKKNIAHPSVLPKSNNDNKIESDKDSKDSGNSGKKKKKGKKSKNANAVKPEVIQNKMAILKKKQKKMPSDQPDNKTEVEQNEDINKENEYSLDYVNPNAITNEDTDSEHESDDEMASDNETINKKAFETDPAESSDDDEEKPEKQVSKPESSTKEAPVVTEDEVKRTLFVGNVPLSKKTKKELKKIFSEYGKIETVRIRTIPVKDARMTPKMAVIKNELHPDRNTVNAYIKYEDAVSVDKALSANNTVLNDHHLRVSRSDSTGATHDPKCSVFVGNIPFALEDEGLRAKFLSCGDIDSVRIVRDKKTNAGKGFGYVNFASKDGVELALALTEEDLTIKNRILRIKRCTQVTQKKQGPRQGNKPGFGNRNNQADRQGFGDRNQGIRRGFGDRNQGNRQGFGDRNQGNRQSFGDRNQGNRPGFRDRNNQGNRPRFGDRNNQGSRPGFGDRNNQGSRFGDRNQGNQIRQKFSRPGQSTDMADGAYRRVMNKRKNMEGSEGPPNKRSRDTDQPIREKKARKEFVGMTAEKKKKPKFSKGQKKKKALSEILTKN